MNYSPSTLRNRIGGEPRVTFLLDEHIEDGRVRCDPHEVQYGEYSLDVLQPLIILNYDKYQTGLPRWENVYSMMLRGDEAATFTALLHHETKRTGNLKSVHLTALEVEFHQ